MPPRYAYWTIIAGGLPTAFRSAERDEILPTFKRIQDKHPDAELKYFARGRLWDSQDEAKRAAEQRRQGRTDRPARGADWRPGGSHRDPRQPFRDAKKARNLRWRKERFERRQQGDGPPERPPRTKPQVDRDQRPPREDQRVAKDARPPRKNQRLGRDDRPPREKPHGDPLRREVRPRFERKSADQRGFRGRPPGKPPRRTGSSRLLTRTTSRRF